MQTSSLCFQPNELKKFIAGDLPSQRVDEVEEHLSTCQTCRSSLEETVGDREWWTDLESALRLDPIDSLHDVHEPSASVYQRLTALLGPTDDPSMLGRIGTYEIVGILGHGGMGAVFKAHDAGLNRYVAIKILLPHLTLSGAARARFRREGRAAAAVIDDHVLPIYAVDEWQGIPYLVMQYTRGVSLQKRLQDRGPLELKEILRIGVHAARGLAAAHAQGLVHRDVKPSNILLDGSVDRAILTDFGLARAVDDASLTSSGVVAGTPQYMSPEQAQAKAIDARSDLFSLGSVLYALCTGHAPFRAESSYAILRLITDEEPRSIREISPDIPEWLCLLISRLMAKSPDARFGNALEVAALLEQCLAHVQQPTSVPLPASLVPHAAGRRSIFNSTRKGIIAMLGTLGMTLLGMVLWQSTDEPDISGQWTSDEWGTVLLNLKQGRYEGTMSNALFDLGGIPAPHPQSNGAKCTNCHQGSAGRIELKWSRLENRFKGSWTHTENVSGKLSLRLADNEIRGAWTMSNKVEEKRGATRLGDLKWTRGHEAVGMAIEPATRITATELEKQIQLRGRELFYGRMELSQEFATLWPTKEHKLERVTSKGTALWLKKGGMTRIESDRRVPGTGTLELHPEQWTTGVDGDRTYSWNRVTNNISYGALRPGALAYAPNLFFWGRSEMAFPKPMFGPNPKIIRVNRDGHDALDVVIDDPQSKTSVRYLGIVPVRGYLPSRVETLIDNRLESQVEFQGFFQPQSGVWAAKTIVWTAWSANDDADGKPIVASRTTFTVTKLELGDYAKLQDDEFKLRLPNDVEVVDGTTAGEAVAGTETALETKSYAILDLPIWSKGGISQHIDLLIHYLEARVGSTKNGGDKIGSYDAVRGVLVLRGDSRKHEQIAQLLTDLRTNSGPPAAEEAKDKAYSNTDLRANSAQSAGDSAKEKLVKTYSIADLPIWSKDGKKQHVDLLLSYLRLNVDPPSWESKVTRAAYNAEMHALAVHGTLEVHNGIKTTLSWFRVRDLLTEVDGGVDGIDARQLKADRDGAPEVNVNGVNGVLVPEPRISNVTITAKTATVSGIGGNNQECVLRIAKSSKNERLEWTAPSNGQFTATVTESGQLPSDNGKMIKGIILTVQNPKSASTTNIAMSQGGSVPAGAVRFREVSAMDRTDTMITFADIVCDDGTSIPVSILLRNKDKLPLPAGKLSYKGIVQEWVGGERLAGTILADDGSIRAVPNATLQLYRVSRLSKSGAGYQFEEIEVFKSDDKGHFNVSIPEDLKRFMPTPHTKEWDEWESLLLITTSAPGFATNSITLAANRDLSLIELIRGTSINGRFVDENGKPVVGAHVTVNDQSRSTSRKEMDEWLRQTSRKPLPKAIFDPSDKASILAARTPASIANHHVQWIPTQIEGVLTDQDGRFKIDGVGIDDVVDLNVECIGYRSSSIKVIGRDLETVYSRDPFSSGENIAVHGRNFKTILEMDKNNIPNRHKVMKSGRN